MIILFMIFIWFLAIIAISATLIIKYISKGKKQINLKKQEPTYNNPSSLPENKVSSINILMIVGTILVIIAALVFATTNWYIIPNHFKVAIIFSFSLIFFICSYISKRKLKLKKTEILFYTLGSIFLPITIIAAGYYKVFGSWFSLFGNGNNLFIAIIFISLSAVCIKSCLDYKNKAFLWCGLISFSISIIFAVKQFFKTSELISLSLAIFSIALLLLSIPVSKIKSTKIENFSSQFKCFANLNAILLSFSSFYIAFNKENAIIALSATVIFAICYLKMSFAAKHSYASTIPFTILISMGIFSFLSPQNTGEISSSLVFISAILLVLSLMNIISDSFKRSVIIISGIFSGVTTFWCILTAFFAKPSILTLCTYLILTAEIAFFAVLHKKQKSGRIYVYILPFSCIITALMSSKIIFENSTTSTYLLFAFILTLLQMIFILIKPLKIRTLFSDLSFSIFSIISGIVLLIKMPDEFYQNIFLLAIVIFISVSLILPAIGKKTNVGKIPFLCLSMLWLGFAATPLPHNNISLLISILSVSALYIIILLCIGKKFGKSSLLTTALVCTRIVWTVYFLLLVMLAEQYYSVMPVLFTVLSLYIGIKFKNNTEFVWGIILSIFSIGIFLGDFGRFNISEIILVMGCASAILYIISLILRKNSFVKLLTKTSGIILFIISSICMIYLSSSDFKSIYSIITFALLILSITALYKSELTIIATIPLCIFYTALSNQTNESGLIIGNFKNCCPILISIAFYLSILTSYILHRNELHNVSSKRLYIDSFIISRFFALYVYFSNCHNSISRWFGLLLLGLNVLTIVRKNHSMSFQRIIYTICCIFPVIACISQPFSEIPDVIHLEFCIAPILIYFFVMKLLWKNHTVFIDGITFAVYVLTYIILFIDAVPSEYVIDGLIIVVSALAMLIISFIIKKKKWFLLSVIVIVATTLFMSRNFWTNLAWWIYLMTAGLILIAIGILNELKRQSALKNQDNNIQKKITRFMSEWTW